MLAQGIVTFDNSPLAFGFESTVDRMVYADRIGGTPLANATYQAGLFELVGGNYVQLGALCSFDFGGATWPGYWNTGASSERTISKGRGAATTLQVRIFDGAGNFLGASPDFSYTHSSVDPLPTDGTLMNNFTAFAVPEPSTVALGVLGLGALLLFRRRK